MSPEQLDAVLLAACLWSLTFAPRAEKAFDKKGRWFMAALFAVLYYASLFHVVEVVLR